jgi:hypothetical protein
VKRRFFGLQRGTKPDHAGVKISSSRFSSTAS